jgi:dipeptidyl aminopeptidase/acylaminoacyl peptidase
MKARALSRYVSITSSPSEAQTCLELLTGLETPSVDETVVGKVVVYIRRSAVDRNRPDEEGVEELLVDPAGELHVFVRDSECVPRHRLMLRLVSLAPLAALPLDCTGKNLSWRSGVIIGDHPTRKTVRILSVGPHGASKVAFSPDGHTLAIGRSDGIDAVYDLRTGRRTGKLVGAGSIDDIDFSPDGKLLASASLTGTVTLWNVARRSKLRDLPGAILLYAVRFSPDGKLVAVGDSSGTVIFWDTASGRRVGAPLAGHGGGVDSIDFDPDGKTLVTSTDDGKLRLWDVATRKLIGAALPGSNTGGSVHFFPDGKHVLGVFQSGNGIVWNVDPAAWKAKACSVARRNLTHAEWIEFLGRRNYRNVCP